MSSDRSRPLGAVSHSAVDPDAAAEQLAASDPWETLFAAAREMAPPDELATVLMPSRRGSDGTLVPPAPIIPAPAVPRVAPSVAPTSKTDADAVVAVVPARQGLWARLKHWFAGWVR